MVGFCESNRVQCVRWVCSLIELYRREILGDFIAEPLKSFSTSLCFPCFLNLRIINRAFCIFPYPYVLIIRRLIYIIMCCVKVHEQFILSLISGWKSALDLNVIIAVHYIDLS